MMSVWLLLEGQPELAAGAFGLTFALSQQAVWYTPLYWLISLYTIIGRNMPTQMSQMGTANMSELSSYFTTLTQTCMISLLIVAASWI